ncbi:MAG TPA: hypothetical protein VGG64_12660 [Pirellulales bacterium]|jgi:hypothetical protein
MPGGDFFHKHPTQGETTVTDTTAATPTPTPAPAHKTAIEQIRDDVAPRLGIGPAVAYQRIDRLAVELASRRSTLYETAITELSQIDAPLRAALLSQGPTEAVRIIAPPDAAVAEAAAGTSVAEAAGGTAKASG